MKFQIDLSESEQRLDKWIKRKFLRVPQNLLEKLCRKGKITLNEKKVKLSYKIKEGDLVEIPNIKFEKIKKIKKNLNDLKSLKKKIISHILYKDQEKIIINKPPGIAVHGGTQTSLSIDDIKDELKFNLKESPRIVHRIDKETSGLLIIARTYKSSVYLSKKFKDKNIEKFYLAILNGIPKKTNGIIISKIKDKKNKDAVTKYIVLKKIKKRFSFVLLKPETGRKRQIREHCFELGCPILGDKKYFKKLEQNKNIDSNKLFLHAYKLKIIKKDGIKEEFTAALPDHIRKFCYLYKIPINETFINKFVISNILKGAKELKN